MAVTPLTSIPLPVASGTDQVPTDLATALDYVEQRIVMTFATSSARSTAFTAASVTPVAGMLSFLTSPGRYETYNGSAWVPLVPSLLHTDTSAIKGTNWDGVSTLQQYKQRQAVVVGSSSLFTVTLTTPFSNGLLYAQMTAGDNSGSLGFVVPILASHTLSSLAGGAFSQSAVGIAATTTIVVDFDVIGW